MRNKVRELFDRALTCPQCGGPVKTTEMASERTPDGGWRAARATIVCRQGCRTPVKPYPLSDYLPD